MTDTITYAQAYQTTMREEMERDGRIFILGTDLYERGGHFAQVKGLGPEFGAERVRDTPISEAAMVAAGVGSAMNGMRPVVDLNFIDFAFGAMDEILNQAAKIRYMLGIPVPLVIRGSSGVGLFAAQHTNSLEAMFAHTPGLVVALPSAPADVSGLLRSALRGEDPVLFLMHKNLSSVRGPAAEPGVAIPFGQAWVSRPGDDVTVVSYSFAVRVALEAAEKLAAEGISTEVIDLRTVWPLDVKTLVASVRKTGRMVVVSDAPRFASIASEVAATVQEEALEYLDAPVLRLGGRHAPIPHSPALFDALVPGAADVQNAVRSLLEVAV